MKLLELLLQERMQWPDGALWAVQDGDKALKFTGTEMPPASPMLPCVAWARQDATRSVSDYVYVTTLASDWATKAVSKAEYDAAMAASAVPHVCPEDATCTDQGCPHHYASGQPYYVPIQMWYAELSHVIAAAAEGKVVQYLAADGNWYDGSGAFIHPNAYRIKPEEPKTIKVNGFDVPGPMQEAPAEGVRYYAATAMSPEWCISRTWGGWEADLRCLQRGLVHHTEDAAVAHAKAMLGIDPYATEGADDEHA